ncbi:vitamin K epoxide reductase family protein [Salinibacterium sp. GXW1014]|uniref:vitamin K epoxide reductase family protein n=1 Tax=Salinibacterium sp. GXW1014 TaxID=3377838 RepID=UPI003839DB28
MVDVLRARREAWALLATAAVALSVAVACFVLTLHAFSGMSPETPFEPLLLGVPAPTAALPLATLLIAFASIRAAALRSSEGTRTAPRRLAGALLVVAGGVGLLAAWALTADKVVTLTQPEAPLECNFSLLVQCGANLESWQGSLLGFPNPLLGLVGWSAVIAVGVCLFFGIRIADWLWVAFAVGVAAAMAFVLWLIGQSISVLGTLCPWCMVTWSVTIPVFWWVSAELARRVGGPRLSAGGARIAGWWPTLTVFSYLLVAVLAQLRLDVIAHL